MQYFSAYKINNKYLAMTHLSPKFKNQFLQKRCNTIVTCV